MNVDIIAVGKIKEKYIKEGIREYTKRLKPFCNLNIIEVREQKAPESLSDSEREQVLDTERLDMTKRLRADGFIIALCVEGQAFSSEQMAERLQKVMVSGKSHITFIIGGSLGLSEHIKKTADLRLSFSDFTFPHQLMRLILLEQIYRWFKIIRGETYHK
ncbi:MAG: 23S rRNA (pseudouridine(1915)-N(3))-methyltransferase RlmH [Thermoanaerobacterales bacterium]|nr:23S rRNA (pseudouridine(1915)-N(3))-methyltransferase RlmH [Thermoanaerobacterales bacterium]